MTMKICSTHEIVYVNLVCPICDVAKEIEAYQRENESQRQLIALLRQDLPRENRRMTTWLDHAHHTQPHKGCHLCAETWQRQERVT